MSLSNQEYLTAKPKLDYYINNRLRIETLKRKEKDKKIKETLTNDLANLNKITMKIVSYILDEEKTIEQYIEEIEKEFLPLITSELTDEEISNFEKAK